MPRPLVVAQFISLTGTHVTAVALPTLAVLHLDASPLAAALLFALEYGSRGLTAPLAGALVDGARSPRRLLVGTDVVHALVVATVPVAYLLGLLSLPYLVVVAGVSGTLAGITDLGITAVLPRLVAADGLVAANSALAGARAVGQIAGPAAGGMLVQAVGAGLAVAVDAVSYLGSAAVLARLRGLAPATATAATAATAATTAGVAGAGRPGRGKPPSAAAARALTASVREGLAAFRGTPRLTRLALAAAALNLGGAGLGGLYAFTAYRVLGLSPAQVGLTFAAYSGAAVLAVLTATSLIGRLGLERASVVFAPVAAGALALIPVATLDASPTVPLLILVAYQVVFGYCATVWTIAAISLQQRLVPARLVGRVVAVSRTVSVLAIPVGAAGGGLVAQWVGLRPTLVGFAVLAIAGTATVVTRSTGRAGGGPHPVATAAGAAAGQAERGHDHVVDSGQQGRQ